MPSKERDHHKAEQRSRYRGVSDSARDKAADGRGHAEDGEDGLTGNTAMQGKGKMDHVKGKGEHHHGGGEDSGEEEGAEG